MSSEFFSREIEKHIIGAMMFDARAAAFALERMAPEDFQFKEYANVFSAIGDFTLKGVAPDAVLLSRKIDPAFLMEISCEVVSAAMVENHVRAALGYSARRKLVKVLEEQLASTMEGVEIEEIKRQTEEKISVLNEKGEYQSLLVDMPSLDAEMDATFSASGESGFSLPWKGLDLRLSGEQVTVVTGYPSHGKSSVIASIAVHMAKVHAWRWVVCSVEDFPNNRLAKKLIRKHTKKALFEMSKAEYLQAWEWVKEHFVFVNAAREDLTFEKILRETETENRKQKINGLIVDPWSEVDSGKPSNVNETDFIKESLRRARQFSRRNTIETIILAHPQKPRRDKEGNYFPCDLYDISGSHQWRAKCDNGFVVSRDFNSDTTKITVHKVKYSDYGKIMSEVELKYSVKSETYTEHGFMGNAQPNRYGE